MMARPRPAAAPVSPLMDALRPGVQLLPAFVYLPAKGRGKIGLRAALILSQAYYMSKRTGGGPWEYTPAEWSGSTGLSEDQTSRALRVLVDAGYLTRRQLSRVRVMAYTVELSALEKGLLSCVSKTAVSRLSITADLRLCKPAVSRLSLYEKGSFLKERGGEGATRRKRADAVPPAPLSALPGDERTKDAWMAYASELSPAWVASKDAAKCWDLMESKGWEDARGRPFKDWKARARVLLGIWREEKGGAAAEAKAEERAKVAAAAAGSIAGELADARARLDALTERAAAGDWEAVKEGERAWRAANPRTFAAYLDGKRPREWAQNIAALPSGKPATARTPPRR